MKWGFRQNIDNRTEVNPQRPIGTTIPYINGVRSFPFKGLSDFINWNTSSHDAGRIEEPVCNDIFKKAGHEKKIEVEKVEHIY